MRANKQSSTRNNNYLFKQLWVSVRSYVTLFIAEIVAFCGSWLKGKANCAKHSLGEGRLGALNA